MKELCDHYTPSCLVNNCSGYYAAGVEKNSAITIDGSMAECRILDDNFAKQYFDEKPAGNIREEIV